MALAVETEVSPNDSTGNSTASQIFVAGWRMMEILRSGVCHHNRQQVGRCQSGHLPRRVEQNRFRGGKDTVFRIAGEQYVIVPFAEEINSSVAYVRPCKAVARGKVGCHRRIPYNLHAVGCRSEIQRFGCGSAGWWYSLKFYFASDFLFHDFFAKLCRLPDGLSRKRAIRCGFSFFLLRIVRIFAKNAYFCVYE